MIIEETTYVDQAEKVIKQLSEQRDKRGNVVMVTTSKIRNLLAMTADIYNEVLDKEEKLTDEVNARIEYLRMRFVYECGREKLVKAFVEKANILNILKEIKGSRSRYILFNRYMEALVAFHRFYDGRD